MRQKATDIVLTLLLGFVPFSRSSSEEIRILESTNAGIVFEYSPTAPILRRTPEGIELKAERCEYTREIGKPLLPIRTFHIGIPENSSYSVDLLSIETEMTSPVEMLPVPMIDFSQGLSRYDYRRDEDFYATNRYYPSEQLSAKLPSFLRDQRILPVTVPVARYNPVQKSVAVVTSIRVRVSFNPPGSGKFWKEDPFERIYREFLLNYESSKFWRVTDRRTKQPDDPFIRSNFWYRISTTEGGLHKVGHADLKALGVNPNSIDPLTIKLYNGGGKPLPQDLTEPRPELREIPGRVVGGEDGSFDSEDYLVFYGVPASRWEYDMEADDYSYFENPYADTNVFWLTWGGEEGLRMQVQDASIQNPNPIVPTHFETPLRIEQNRINSSKIANAWEWEVIELGAERTYTFETHGVEPGSAYFHGRLRTSKPPRTGDVTHRFTLYLNDPQRSHPLTDTSVTWEASVNVMRWTDRLLEGINEIAVRHYELPGDDPNSVLNTDFFEIRYSRTYTAVDNQLFFSLPRPFLPGTYQFGITEFTSSQPFLLDVTDPLDPKMLTNFDVAENHVRFQTDIDTRTFYSLTCFEELKNPSRIEVADFQHLRSSSGGDYVALVYDDFFLSVQPLIAWRRQRFAKPVAVKISSVYDEFSWGLKDPTAIRDFLKFWYDNAPYRPDHCLLLGDGSYDYKNYLKLENPDNFIPPTPTCEDNWYGMLNPDDSYRDVLIGRVNPHSPQEAQSVITRIIDYESRPNYGFWRNRVLLLADNTIEAGGDFPGDIEELAAVHTPHHFDTRKIHLVYRTYDEPHEWAMATEDAIEEWSRGFLAGCYMGHGGPHTVAHEQLLLYKHIASLENEMRLPFFYFASCDIGRFDVPNDPCMGEDLLKADEGGAIGVVAASRATIHPDNRPIAYDLFDQIFFATPTPTLGEALLFAKPGKSVHTLFGDPATQISSASLSIPVAASPDSLAGRSMVTVIDSFPEGFSGYANIYVFDSAEFYPVDPYLTLQIPGVPIFRGTIRAEGVDTLSFMVPMQLQQTGELGRISCYGWNDTVELVGLLDSLKVGGLDSLIPDTAGPSITLLEEDRVLKDGDFVPPIFQLNGILEDPYGIYIVPRKPPWFFVEVNEYLEADLSGDFMYDVGSSTRGRFSYTLRLNEGENEIKVVARDNLLNRTVKKVRLGVTAPTELAIEYAFNYPNPFSDWTYFTFYLTQNAEVEIKVFTVSGTLIQSIGNIRGVTGQNRIYWNGRDFDGDVLANGIYIYKIIARTRANSSEWGQVRAETTTIEKLVVMR
jgi:hypothetical protein